MLCYCLGRGARRAGKCPAPGNASFGTGEQYVRHRGTNGRLTKGIPSPRQGDRKRGFSSFFNTSLVSFKNNVYLWHRVGAPTKMFIKTLLEASCFILVVEKPEKFFKSTRMAFRRLPRYSVGLICHFVDLGLLRASLQRSETISFTLRVCNRPFMELRRAAIQSYSQHE